MSQPDGALGEMSIKHIGNHQTTGFNITFTNLAFLWRADTGEVVKYASLFAPSMSTDNAVDLLYGSTPTPIAVERFDEDVDCSFIDDLL